MSLAGRLFLYFREMEINERIREGNDIKDIDLKTKRMPDNEKGKYLRNKEVLLCILYT
jgi:hypothetical protein